MYLCMFVSAVSKCAGGETSSEHGEPGSCWYDEWRGGVHVCHRWMCSCFCGPSTSKKRRCESQEKDNQPYIKKPPNAFMLFREEQRPNVVAELNIRDSATVNTVLGQRWNSLSKEEQAKYYVEAEKERRLHAQQFPEWSSRDNYGKKRKRQRSRAPTRAEASASKPLEVTQPAKKLCVAPEQMYSPLSTPPRLPSFTPPPPPPLPTTYP
ncbi:transcription factor 7-like 1, partial [Toxotes jaculatrix]|uniref:transcription factor 7-like 1 n=1 Tax=Toxotes jaculatrix TaxID=941984 RepID=UPI001B3A8619